METKSKLKFESGEDSLEFRSFSAEEGLNTLFEVVVECVSANPDVNLEALVGKHASLAVESNPPRVWSGVVRRAGQMQGEEDANGKPLSTYKIHIAPSLWRLSLRRGHRIFQHMSIKDVVEQVLKDGGVELQDRLKETYPKLEYCVQYGETEIAFVSRLMERAGISYWFEQTGDKTVMVLDDKPQAAASKGTIPVREGGSHKDENHAAQVAITHGVASGLVTTRDYDFRRPDYELFGVSDKAPGAEGAYEDYLYLPGHALVEGGSGGATPQADDHSVARHELAVAKHDAAVRFGGHRALKRAVHFTTNWSEIGVGSVLQLKEHPHPEAIKPLLVVRTHCEGSTASDLRVHAQAVAIEAPVRPYPSTKRPRIEGLQTAIVVGPPGQEIYTDEFGRVRVKFPWDRIGQFDDNATCWLRVSQMWAGPAWGGVLVPRVGHEVLVSFEEGDPDRPVVVGRLFNATAVTPYILPDNKPKSTWKSDTSPHEDNSFSEIMMDDAAGNELLFIQSQRDYRKLVKRHETERVFNDREHVVGKSRVSAIRETDGVQIGKRRLVQMIDPQELEITTGKVPQVTIKDTFIELKDEHITLHAHHSTIELKGPEIRVTAKAGIRFTAESTLVIQGGPNVYFNDKGAKSADHDGGDDFKDRVVKPIARLAPAIKDLKASVTQPTKLPAGELEMKIPKSSPLASAIGAMASAAKQLFNRVLGNATKPVAKVKGPGKATPQSLALAKQIVKAGGTGTQEDVDVVVAEIARLPSDVLRRAKAAGVTVVACRGSVTDHLTYLKGVQPRGYSPGKTWDSVPGLQHDVNGVPEVVIATESSLLGGRQIGTNHGSANMPFHEFGHAMDSVVQKETGTMGSLHNDFVTARDADKAIVKLDGYYTQPGDAGLSESYAESFAKYHENPSGRDWLNMSGYWDSH